jgi:large subunit ribosomal protein L5
MNILEQFKNDRIPYEFINKFNYKITKKIPKLKKIILNFGCKSTHIKTLSTSLLALELITNQKGTLTKTQQANILLKIRKNQPVGCKVTLKSQSALSFISLYIINVIARSKYLKIQKIKKKELVYSYLITEPLLFKELEKNYSLFNTLNVLSVTVVTKSKTNKELKYILKLFKFPITCIYNSIGRV